MYTANLDEARERRAAAVEGTRALAESLAQPDPIPEQYLIREPGVYPDIPADIYHRDPVVHGSVSSSGIRKLVEPGGPARFRWAADHPEDERQSDAFDLGRALHQVALHDPENRLVIVDADDWRTTAARGQRDNARAAGFTPLLRKHWEQVRAMADAIERHRLAGALLHPTTGRPEQTAVWHDADSGVWCRIRVDWLRHRTPNRRLILVDLKSVQQADRHAFGKSVADYGYAIQAWLYSEGARALDLDPEPGFVFVCVEKDPPHLVNVLELPEEALAIGRNLTRIGLNAYADGMRSGRWPGHGEDTDIDTADLPVWWLRQYDEATK